jgi:DEAD/DEAH box helicase domain-containing protein
MQEYQTIVIIENLNFTIVKYWWHSSQKPFIKDINFGVPDNQSEQISVAGEIAPRSGFSVCKKCGLVKKGNKIKHDLTCSFKGDELASQDPDNFIDCLYLYRELESEAI